MRNQREERTVVIFFVADAREQFRIAKREKEEALPLAETVIAIAKFSESQWPLSKYAAARRKAL